MSRTKRCYNRKESFYYVHPYHAICYGRCRSCRKYFKSYKKTERGLELKFLHEPF